MLKTLTSFIAVAVLGWSGLSQAEEELKVKITTNLGVIEAKLFYKEAPNTVSNFVELARKGFFAEEDAGYNKDSTEFLHTENVLLIDKNKHIRGLYKGTLSLDMQHLITDINILKKEN